MSDIWNRALYALDDGEWIDGEWRSPSPEGRKLIEEALLMGDKLEKQLEERQVASSRLPEDD